MSHATFQIAPGVNTNRTPALNQAQLSECNLIRFMYDPQGAGLVQKLGGWTRFYPGKIDAVIRALWAWEDTNANQYLAAGAETPHVIATNAYGNGAEIFINYVDTGLTFAKGSQVVLSGFLPQGYNGVFEVLEARPGPQLVLIGSEKNDATQLGTVAQGSALYVLNRNTLGDITPGFQISQPKASITTTKGSATVVITDPNVTVETGDIVYIKTQISVGGIVLFGSYYATNISPTEYSIQSVDFFGNPNPATADETSGGVLPAFDFVTGTPFITVTLPDHGYQDGDTFPVLIPVQAGSLEIYGNYIVDLSLVTDTKDQFTIISHRKADNVYLLCVPDSITSDGTHVTLNIQQDYGCVVGDKLEISNTIPDRDGRYIVTAVTDSAIQFADTSDWNNLENVGYFFKCNGGDGSNYRISYSGNYYASIGDTIALSQYIPSEYNGEWTVSATGKSSMSFATTAKDDIVNLGFLFVKTSHLNGGFPYYQYYNSADIVPVGTGYGLGGYGIGGYGIGGQVQPPTKQYTPVVAFDWLIDNWGENLIACAPGGPIYYWSPTSGQSTCSIIAEAPIVNDGAFVAMPQRQIIAWGSTETGIQDPLLVRWCDVSNYNVWTPTVTNQAGSYRISKGSKIVGGLQGPQQALIWTDLALWSMQYIGQPYVYSFNEVGTGCGLIGRKSAGSMNGVVYWMSQTQFFMLAGDGVQTIPCPIWDRVFQQLDTSNVDKIRFAANSNFNEVAWYYPTLLSNGEVSAYVKYNVMLQCWDYGQLDRTAWINQSIFGPPIGASANGYIYQHETSYDADGQVMNSYFKTGYAQMGEGEVKLFVDQIWPDFKWGAENGPQTAILYLTFYVADYPTDVPKKYGPYRMDQTVKFITPRFRGRLVSMEVSEFDPPKNTKTFWRTGALRYRVQPDGKF